MPKRTFKVGDDIYDIEESESASFLKDMPDAKEVKSFTVGKDTFDIDINEVDDFLADMPDAKPINGVQKKSPDQTKSKPISFGSELPFAPTSEKVTPLLKPTSQSPSQLPSVDKAKVTQATAKIKPQTMDVPKDAVPAIEADIQAKKDAVLTKQMLYDDMRYARLTDKKQAQERGYNNVQDYYKDRESYLINNYLTDNDKEEARAQNAFLEAKKSGNEKLAAEEMQNLLNAKSAFRKEINEQRAEVDSEESELKKGLENGMPQNAFDASMKVLNQKRATLDLMTKPYYDPKKAMNDVLSENISEVAAVSKPSQTAKEKLTEYTNALYTQLNLMREDLGWDADGGALDAYAKDFQLRNAGKGELLDKMYQTELKLRNAVKILELNRTPIDNETALGVFGKSFATGINPASASRQNTEQIVSQNLQSINEDAGISEAVDTEQKKFAEEGAKEYKPYSTKWFAQPAGTSAAIMLEFIPSSMATEGAMGLTKIGKLIDIAEKYGKVRGLNTTAKYIDAVRKYKAANVADKIGKFVLKTQANGLKFGATSEMVATLFPKDADEVNFTTGYFGGQIGKGAEQVLGGAATSLFKLFGNKAPEAAKAIESLGEKFKYAKEAPKNVIGEIGEEFGESLGQIYSDSDSWKEIKSKLDDQFGTLDKATQFAVQTGIMALGMGGGSAIGTNLMKASKDAYNKLDREQRVVVDEVLDSVSDEEVAVTNAVANNVAQDLSSQIKDPKAQQEIRDAQITKFRNKTGKDNTVELVISPQTLSVLSGVESGEAVSKEDAKVASDDLYREYKRLEASKQSDTRLNTIEEITAKQNEIGEQISALENIQNEGTVNENTKKAENIQAEPTVTEDTGVSNITEPSTTVAETTTPTAQDEIASEVVEPTAEQQLEDVKNGDVVTFEYKTEAEVPEVFKDKVSSTSETNGEKTVRVTVPKSLAEYELAKQEMLTKSPDSLQVGVESKPKSEPTKVERKKIAEAKIDEVAQALKDFLPSVKGVKKSGFGQDEIIDAVASAVKALVNSGIEINEAIKQVKAKLSEHFDVSELNDDDIKSRLTKPEKAAPTTQDRIAELETALASAKSESKKKVLQEKIDELKAPAPKRKERRLTKQMINDSSLSNEFKATIGEDEIYYNELPNKVTLDEANAIIDYLGEDAARREVSNMANGMRLPVRNTIAQILIRRYEKQGDYDAAIDVREELVTSATEQGQGVQSFAMWPSLSPEGEVIKMQREITKQREKKKAQAKPVTDKITKGLRQANKEAAEEAVAKVQKKVDKSSEIEPTEKKRPADYGSNNKLVTKAKYEAAKKALRGKMFAAVITPELIEIGAYHIEAGSRKFADFADAMVDDLGKKVIPYLRDIYNTAKSDFEDVSEDSEIDMYYGAIDGAKWKEKLEKAIAKGDKKAAAEAMDALKKIGTDEGLWGKYRDSAVNRLKNVPLEKVAGEIKENPALQDFTNGLIRNMEEKIAEGVAGEEVKGEPKKQRKAIEVIGDAFKNIEKYEEVWDKTQAEFVEKYKDTPEVLEALDEYFGQILDKPFSKASVTKAVKQGLVDMNQKISDIVVKHYTVQDYAKQSLANRLVKEAGLTGAEAKVLADAVKAEFDKIATAKKQQIIEKSLGRKERKAPTRKSLEEELIRLTNIGAFSNEDVVKAYGDKMGWPKMTPEQVKGIERLATAVQEAPEGFKQFRAVEDLLSYQASIPGVSLTDIAMSIWYANVLSGQNTQLVNVVGNMANSTALYANASLQNPKAAAFIANGFVQGFRKGLLEAKATWATGYSPIRGKVEVPSTLERTTFWGGSLNPASYAKYVRRLMVASDVIMFEAQKEMRAYQLAWKQAAQKEMLEPSQSQRDAALDILDKTDETVELSKIEAAEEYADEVAAINASSLSDAEKAAKIKKAKQDEKRRVYELVEYKRSDSIKEDSATFAARGTYNYKPEGALGVFANQMNSLKSFLGRSADEQTKAIPKIGAKTLSVAMNFIVPFTNIIANVANESINYSPIGAARAKAGGSLTGNRKTPLTDQEKVDLYTKAIIGTSLMAAAYALATIPAGDDDEPLIEVTANGTGDYRKNYELQKTGWQPYSIKVGGRWISYQYTPMMLGLAFIGNIKDRERYHNEKLDEEGFGDKVSIASGYTMLALFDMTFLTTLNKTLSTIADPRNEDRVADLGQQTKAIAKGFVVPALYTQGARKIEEIMNIPTKEVRGTIMGDMLKDIPVARDAYYNKVDGLGDPVVADTDKITSRTPQDDETAKLWTLISEKRAFVGVPSIKTLRVYDATIDKERTLTQEEFFKFATERGRIIKEELNKSYDKLKSMPAKDVQDFMKELKSDATEGAKAKLFKPQ